MKSKNGDDFKIEQKNDMNNDLDATRELNASTECLDVDWLMEERVFQERAEIEAEKAEKQPPLDFVSKCLDANTLGDANLYAYLNRDRYVHVKNYGSYLEWGPHSWHLDVMGGALVAVEGVVSQYFRLYDNIHSQIVALSQDGGNDGAIAPLRTKQGEILLRVKQLRDERRRNSVLTFAHTIENPLAIVGDELDQQQMRLAVSNGVIDLEVGCRRPGRPRDYISLASPVEWQGINAQCQLWERTVRQICNEDEEMEAYWQRLLGYAITGSTREKIFVALHGPEGYNGKTTMMNTVMRILGPMAGAIPTELLLSSKHASASAGPSPDIMTLRPLRLAVASEAEDNQRFASARIKLLTGRNQLVGRNPHDKHYTRFMPQFKLFLETNSYPSGPTGDPSFYERLHLIPFKLTFVNRDPVAPHERRAISDLDKQLEKEYPGILAWLVRGCLLWQTHGLQPPALVREHSEMYRKDEDLLIEWIADRLEIDPGARASATALHENFSAWYIENHGQNVPSPHWLGKQLRKRYAKTKRDGRNYYTGISIC